MVGLKGLMATHVNAGIFLHPRIIMFFPGFCLYNVRIILIYRLVFFRPRLTGSLRCQTRRLTGGAACSPVT